MIQRIALVLVFVGLTLSFGASANEAPSPTAISSNPDGWTDGQLQGYACLAGGALAVTLVALAGPTEVAHVMGGADFFWTPSSEYVTWTAVVAGAGALVCSMAGMMVPAVLDAWNRLPNVFWTPAVNP